MHVDVYIIRKAISPAPASKEQPGEVYIPYSARGHLRARTNSQVASARKAVIFSSICRSNGTIKPRERRVILIHIYIHTCVQPMGGEGGRE